MRRSTDGYVGDTNTEGITPKRTRPSRPQTNGKAKAFIHILLRELAYLRPYCDNSQRLFELPRFVHRYSRARPHFGLRGRTPVERLCQQH